MLRARVDASPDTIFHGGNLSLARSKFPFAAAPWLDLSTGINAIPYPVCALSQETWARLPDIAEIERLQEAAANAYGCRESGHIVPAGGTQVLIQWLPRLFPTRRVAILGFGYQEHPAVWQATGAEVTIVEDFESLASRDVDVAVIVNPNNPDGRLIKPQFIRDLAATLHRRGGLVVIDEAFMDVVRPSMSLIPSLPEDGAIVLRSFGKTYGLAGMRLGFAVAGARLAEILRKAIGPWAVSGPAITVGAAALTDKDWLDKATVRLISDAHRLDALLKASGFEILGGTPLFRLVQHSKGRQWFMTLGQAGILVRPFPERPNWLRFGIPGREEDWARLQQTIRINSV